MYTGYFVIFITRNKYGIEKYTYIYVTLNVGHK